LIFTVLISAFTFIYNAQLSDFVQLEKADTLQKVENVQKDIITEQRYLDYFTVDWACWSETYQFIEDRNQKYIDTNLQNQTLATMNIDVAIFANNSGHVVYAKSLETNTLDEKPVQNELLKLVEDGTLLVKGEDDNISGFVLLNEGPMLISCYPILTTDMKGPLKGTLIFGRYFDSSLLNNLQNITQSSLLMYRTDEKPPSDFQIKSENLYKERSIIEPLNEEKIAGYFEINDIKGRPALIMRADFPRDLYSHEKKKINYMYFSLLLIGLITGIGVKFSLDRLFISRLTVIDNFVTKIRSEKDLSKRLPLKSNDELYRLSKEINEMLNDIYLAEHELKAQEREKKVLLDSLNELVIFIDPNLNLIWANKAALEYMNISLQEAAGMSIKTTSGIINPLSEYMSIDKLFETGNNKSGEYTAEDNSVWFVQAIPVTNEDGKIIGVLETCRDITEKDKADKMRKKEINHRIKNNLQIVSSLLALQAEKFSDKKVVEAFKESENRILSMSLIHQELYESGKLDTIDFSSYLHKLIADLLMSCNSEIREIKVNIDVSSVFLWVDTAVSLGIIVNELFTNSVKYAFPAGTDGEICISLTRENFWKDEIYKFVFADNGIGFPEGINFRNPDTLGLQLINALVDQINGYIEVKQNNGTEFEIWFRSSENEN
jgi:sensor domain CHASE-containing protein/two-component sensor histidine kinase